MKRSCYTQKTANGEILCAASTDNHIRLATPEEIKASDQAALLDDGCGLILVELTIEEDKIATVWR